VATSTILCVYYYLPSSSVGTSLDAIDRMAMKDVPFTISTIAAETHNYKYVIYRNVEIVRDIFDIYIVVTLMLAVLKRLTYVDHPSICGERVDKTC